MRKLFEEYGDIIIVIIAITALVGVITAVIKLPMIQTQFSNAITEFFQNISSPATPTP